MRTDNDYSQLYIYYNRIRVHVTSRRETCMYKGEREYDNGGKHGEVIMCLPQLEC